MKKLKLSLLSILFLIPFFSSCSIENSKDKPIIDYRTFSHLTIWKEIERKVGAANWEPVSNSQNLSLFSNSADSVKPRNGAYKYNLKNLEIKNDASGDFLQKDSLLYFIAGKKLNDTTTVDYKIREDSILIINNFSMNPNIRIKYKKSK